MTPYDVAKFTETPAGGKASIDAFFTVKNDTVYAILPRRPIREVILDDIETSSGLRVTLLEGGPQLESTRQGNQLRIRIPETLSASLPARQAYVLKLAGAK